MMDCGDHFAIYTNIELCCIPEIKCHMSIIAKKKPNKQTKKHSRNIPM